MNGLSGWDDQLSTVGKWLEGEAKSHDRMDLSNTDGVDMRNLLSFRSMLYYLRGTYLNGVRANLTAASFWLAFVLSSVSHIVWI